MADTGRWLLTGAAGYIGSHVARGMLSAGLDVAGLDDLSTGRSERVADSMPLIVGDCRDAALVHEVCQDLAIVGVVHLAALKQARESAREPARYWNRNVPAMTGVLQGIAGTGVRVFLLSSSCSVYGAAGPVSEDSPLKPVSPYGWTKLVSERALADSADALGLSWLALRYFNVIGNADFPLAHDTSEECLVPATLRRIEGGTLPEVFGTDLPTPDGTCLRDYVDVRDLAEAHVLAALLLSRSVHRHGEALNVAVGAPVSVLEVLSSVFAALDRPLEYVDAGSRPGDPDAIWATGDRAGQLLSWSPRHGVRDSVEAFVRAAAGVQVRRGGLRVSEPTA